MGIFQRLGFAALLVTFATGVVQAQPSTQVTIPQRGVTPAGFYGVSDIETIDSVSGNLSLRIPITSFPAGRTGASAPVALTYNSSIYAWYGEQLVNSDFISPGDSGGWHYSYDYNFTHDYIPPDFSKCNTTTNYAYFRYRLVTPDGGSHVLLILGRSDDWHGYYPYQSIDCSSPAETGILNFYTADGTYLRMTWNAASGDWTAYLPDGHIVTGQEQSTTRIVDRNGNGFSISRYGASPLTTTLTDDLGRTITIQHTVGPGQAFAEDIITQTVTDISSGTSVQQTLTWTVNWTLVALDADHTYKCTIDSSGLCNGSNLSGLMVTSVVLPSQLNAPTPLQYTFTYATDVSPPMQWGQLSTMQLPTGAQVLYAYKSQPWGPIPGATIAPFPVVSKTLTWQDQADSAQRSESTSYSFSNTQSIFTNPDGGSETHIFYDTLNANPDPNTGLVYKVIEPSGDVVERVWSTNVPLGSTNWPPTYHVPGNPVVQMELTTKAGAASLTSAKTFTYDRNGNRRRADEYDFANSSGAVTHTGNVPTSFTGGSLERTTINTYLNGASMAIAGSAGASTDDSAAYWNAHTPQLLNLISQTTVSGSGPGSNISFVYDNGTLSHGNITQENRWDSQTNTYETVLNTYDSYGNFSSLCSNAASIGSSGNLTVRQNERGYSTVFCYDANADRMVRRVEAAQTADARTFDYVYDPSPLTANLQSTTDMDHSITRSFRWDAFGRNVWETEGNVRTTQTAYDDAARQISVRSDRDSNGDGMLVEKTWFDQLGRVRLSQDWAGNYVQKRYIVPYQTGFSYEVSSNPYITAQESTMGWTRTARDVQGRIVELKHFSGSGLPTPWTGADPVSTGSTTTTFYANCVTAADEAQVSRTNCLDGLGRLYQVTENGIGATTTYGYDALDNLVSTAQPGVAPRTFTYSSLGRLTSASNPETGPITYAYYPGGNLRTKTDSRSTPITVTYVYNPLDQLTDKQYSDSATANPTPWVHNAYNKSWLTQVQAGPWSYNNTAFDSIGRVQDAAQSLSSGPSYGFHVTYKPVIGIDTITYPNPGRVVRTTYDAQGRPYGLTGQVGANPQTNYAISTTYQADGAIQTQTLANGNLVVSRSDNARLQPQTIQAGNLLTLTYGYSPTNNNGNLTSQTINRPGIGAWTQSYGYAEPSGGSVNRLTAAQESGTWSQTYGYDNRGNRWVNPNTIPYPSPFTPGFSSNYDASNHLNIQNSLYDGAGNQTQIGGFQFQYDAENRMTASTFNQTTTYYGYDGLGRRVTKTVSGQTTTYIYDPFGNLAQEYGVISSGTSTMYPVADALGSTRVVADSNGAAVRCYDYLPFGEELGAGTAGRTAPCFGNATYPATGPDVVNQKFTGKERDAESGLDFFEARYYSGAQGRFTSPDQPLIDQNPADPQSWNLYSYVRNNPLISIDPTGRDCVTLDNGTFGDDGKGTPCKEAQLTTTQSVTVTAEKGNVLTALALNTFFALDNFANDYFRFLTDAIGIQPSYMQNIPTSDSATGKLAAAAVFVGTTVNPKSLLTTSRTALLEAAENPKLRNIIGNLYRQGARLGTGSTADAIRYELETGVLLSPKGHFLKGVENRTALQGLLRDPSLSASDKQIVKQLLIDLQNALSGR